MGYEDINDHDHLRHDPVLQELAGKLTRKRSNCAALAGKSTLNRLEHAAKVGSDPYHKISYDEAAIAALFVTLCLESYVERPTRMIIGTPRMIPSTASRRVGTSTAFTTATAICHSTSSAVGICSPPSSEPPTRMPPTAPERRLLASLRKPARAGPRCRSSCAQTASRDDLMAWCEDNGVDYIFGLARNERLVKAIRRELAQARRESRRTKCAARRFKVLEGWETRES